MSQIYRRSLFYNLQTDTQHKQSSKLLDLEASPDPAPYTPPLSRPISNSINGDGDERNELSELFEDIEQLVAPPHVLVKENLLQPAPPLHAIYNPSLVTPGAPSHPSARHRIAKMPYHLSTNHHSAVISLLKRSRSPDSLFDNIHLEPIVPQKRPNSSHNHDEGIRKRSCLPLSYTNTQQLLSGRFPITPEDLAAPTVPQKRSHVSQYEEMYLKRACAASDYPSDQQAPKLRPTKLADQSGMGSSYTFTFCSPWPQGILQPLEADMGLSGQIEQPCNSYQTLSPTNNTDSKFPNPPYVDNQNLTRSPNQPGSPSQDARFNEVSDASHAQFTESIGRKLTNERNQNRPSSAPHQFNPAPECAPSSTSASRAQSQVYASEPYLDAQILSTTDRFSSSSSQDGPFHPKCRNIPTSTQPQEDSTRISNPPQDCLSGFPLRLDQFQFDFGENHNTRFVVIEDPPPIFDQRPDNAPSHTQRDFFQQAQTQPTALTSLPDSRQSSRTSICSANNQQYHERSSNQSGRLSRMSYCSTHVQQPNPQPAQVATTIYQHPLLAISSRSSRVSTHQHSSDQIGVINQFSNELLEGDQNPSHDQSSTYTQARVTTPDPERSVPQVCAIKSPGYPKHLKSACSTIPNGIGSGLFRPDSSQTNTRPAFHPQYHLVPQPQEFQTHHEPDLVTHATKQRGISVPPYEEHTRLYRPKLPNPPSANPQIFYPNRAFLQAPTPVFHMANQVKFDIGRDHIPSFGALLATPSLVQSFNTRPGERTSQTQRDIFQQPSPQPINVSLSRPSLRMSISPVQKQPPLQRGQSSWVLSAANNPQAAPYPPTDLQANSRPTAPRAASRPAAQAAQGDTSAYHHLPTASASTSMEIDNDTSTSRVLSAANNPCAAPYPPPHPVPRPTDLQASSRPADQGVPRRLDPHVARRRTTPQAASGPTSRPTARPTASQAASRAAAQAAQSGPTSRPTARPTAPRAASRPAAQAAQRKASAYHHRPTASTSISMEIDTDTSTSNSQETEDLHELDDDDNDSGEDHQEDLDQEDQHGEDKDKDNQHREDKDEDEQDTEESDLDGVYDLVETRKYQNRKSARRVKKTIARHNAARLEKLAKPPAECSQYERLAIAIHHFNNMLLGIVRKGRGRKGNRFLPLPPSDKEYSVWDKRKVERRRLMDKSSEQARSRYQRKYPSALPAQLARVGDHAAEEAISTIPPVKFTLLVPLRNSGVRYSTTMASTCEATLALSGFTRFTYDWTDSFKSKWNEAVSAIILQEWEKCYRRGDANDYYVDVHQVTAKNIREVLERWFNTKVREYVNQCGQEGGKKRKQPHEQEVLKEKSRRRQSQKKVCKLRKDTFKRFFPENRALGIILSERSVHSEDEVDADGHSYRKQKLWRHRDLTEFLHELDKLHIKDQQSEQASTSALKALDRGPYTDTDDADFLARPPKGFPKSLLNQEFMKHHVSRVAVLDLELSSQEYDITPFVEHATWLQLTEGS
ncbi:uncharacterized protein MELLADRAFT_95815 [Melampsora larici-populina 98AG31]|uniref:Uncharacterized protein n=1 Tax=Melampsora larici-populina (strain 98AG31 / pathotype 3-4-7) TaxID=747676 RepID=F4RDB5_MELLP|nr:uncharacterized protein MELLADRAFT_95815 [Melampsora larici-populina 98AG31]EGG09372.1 hypothetical protein MELLADRAFT_95815 [Melampsora larici-populina 98AG31]